MQEELDPQHFGVTPELFKEWGAPRYGNANPQKIKSNVWEWLVRSKLSAYASRQKIEDPSILAGGPTWCFDRFGQSVTDLPDGRTVYIAGEHEDYYDQDFYIYNDVVVTHPDGAIDFYCYPKSDFPPTDFHTATLVDDRIVIIGSLGYRDERNPNETQVYILRMNTFEIQKVETSGMSPGWIHRHTATLSEDQKSILVTKGKVQPLHGHSLLENCEDWKLHLDDWSWEKLTSRNWTQFAIWRKDKRMIPLWDIRHALWNLEHHMEDSHKQDMERIEQFINYRPDVRLMKDLYNFDLEQTGSHNDENEYNLFWIYMEDVRVRFTEEWHCLQVVIEGGLAAEKVSLIKQQLTDKLSALVNSPCEVEEY
jgi:hypothetical protein